MNIWTGANDPRVCQSGPGSAPFLHISQATLFQLLLQTAVNIKWVSVLKTDSQVEMNTLQIVQMLQSPFQVGVHIVKSLVFCQVHQHSCGTATISGPTEAAVTDPSAWRAQPLLPRTTTRKSVRPAQHTHDHTTSHVFGTHRIQKSVADLLSVAVTKTGATELTPHPPALWITAVGFGVRCFLAALVASGALKITRKAVRPRAQRANAAAQIFSASQRLRDLQWRGCRLYPARCRRCSAALPARCHPQAARRGGWPLHLWKSGNGAAREINEVNACAGHEEN